METPKHAPEVTTQQPPQMPDLQSEKELLGLQTNVEQTKDREWFDATIDQFGAAVMKNPNESDAFKAHFKAVFDQLKINATERQVYSRDDIFGIEGNPVQIKMMTVTGPEWVVFEVTGDANINNYHYQFGIPRGAGDGKMWKNADKERILKEYAAR